MKTKRGAVKAERVFTKKKHRTAAAAVAGKIVSAAAVAAFWLGLWALLALRTGSELLLPSPFAVFGRLVRLAGSADLWKATGLTLVRITIGYAAGALAGTGLAALTAWSRHAFVLARPLGRIVKATPVASFIILALVWIPANNIPSFIVFLLVTPIIWDSLRTALLETDRRLLEMASAYGFGPGKTIRHVYVPSVSGQYVSSLLTALALAWKSGIAAEVLCLPGISVGRRLYESKIYLETVDLFAWTTLVVILSVLMELLIRASVKRFTSGREGGADD